MVGLKDFHFNYSYTNENVMGKFEEFNEMFTRHSSIVDLDHVYCTCVMTGHIILDTYKLRIDDMKVINDFVNGRKRSYRIHVAKDFIFLGQISVVHVSATLFTRSYFFQI